MRDHPLQLGGDDLCGGVGGAGKEPPEDPAERQIRSGAAVLLAGDPEGVERPAVDCLRHEAGLSDTGCSDDLDDAPGPGGRGLSGSQESCELVVPPDEGHVVAARFVGAVLGRTHGGGDDGLGLALDLEGRYRFCLERVAGAGKRVVGSQHLALSGLAHDSGGEVHGVAGDREDAALAKAHVMGEHEHPSGVHPGAKPDRGVGRVSRHDVVHGAQHALGVVSSQDGDSTEQDDLAPVRTDVGAVEACPVELGRLLCRPDERVEARCHRLGSFARGQRVDAGEGDERHCCRAMLGLLAATEKMAACLGREQAGDVQLAKARQHRGRYLVRLRCSGHEDTFELGLAEHQVIEAASRFRADEHLSRLGDRLHPCGLSGRRPRDEELAMPVTQQVEVERRRCGLRSTRRD